MIYSFFLSLGSKRSITTTDCLTQCPSRVDNFQRDPDRLVII